jgi:hypothetical protein
MNKKPSSLVTAVWTLLLAALATNSTDPRTVAALITPGKRVSSEGVTGSTGSYQLRFFIYDTATNDRLVWFRLAFNAQSDAGLGYLEVLAAEVTRLPSSCFYARMFDRSQSLLMSAGMHSSLKAGSTSFSTSPTRTL